MNTVFTLVLLACSAVGVAAPASPKISIIIDDIGYDYANGQRAIALPHPFAYAVLPFSPHAEKLAHLANARSKDVLVHLPMEAIKSNHLLGPGALRLQMTRTEFDKTVSAALDAVPHAVGVSNHMGSRLTREPMQMHWLMSAISNRGGLFFIDSRTTSDTVAMRIARNNEVDAVERNVFLDNVNQRDAIEKQLALLIKKAKRNGFALGIAHPRNATISVLSAWQPHLAGVQIVPLSDAIKTAHTPPSKQPSDLTSYALTTPAPQRGNERNGAEATEHPNAQR